jgi:hypothetical protein
MSAWLDIGRPIPKIFAALSVAVIADAASAAPQIEVTALDCANGVHLVAQNAPVSEVLAQLARVKGFRVEASERASTLVTIDSVQSTQRLLTTLLRDENTIVKEEADPHCPGRSRVTMVWIIGKNSVATGVPSAPPKQPAYVTPEAKEQDDLYKRGHGMLPE